MGHVIMSKQNYVTKVASHYSILHSTLFYSIQHSLLVNHFLLLSFFSTLFFHGFHFHEIPRRSNPIFSTFPQESSNPLTKTHNKIRTRKPIPNNVRSSRHNLFQTSCPNVNRILGNIQTSFFQTKLQHSTNQLHTQKTTSIRFQTLRTKKLTS